MSDKSFTISLFPASVGRDVVLSHVDSNSKQVGVSVDSPCSTLRYGLKDKQVLKRAQAAHVC